MPPTIPVQGGGLVFQGNTTLYSKVFSPAARDAKLPLINGTIVVQPVIAEIYFSYYMLPYKNPGILSRRSCGHASKP
jgi:hypothetical protein